MDASYEKPSNLFTKQPRIDKHFKLHKPLLFQGLCFALCFFVFQLTEFTINDRADELFGANKVNFVYSVGIACTALGFLSFSLLRKLFESVNHRKCITCIAGLCSIITSIILLTTNSGSIFLLCAWSVLFFYGHIGGSFYYHAAMTFFGCPYSGRIIGIGMGVAVLLQFILQNFAVDKVTFMICVVISVCILLHFVIKPPKYWMFENPLPYSVDNHTDKRTAAILIIATILMSFVIALIDGVVVQKHAVGSLSVSSYARLFYAFSLSAAGFIADIKNRKYLSLVTVCVLFISTISVALISKPSTFFWATAFMYMYSGFYVMYFTLSFLDFAPKTKFPDFWAGFGRVLRSIVAAVTAIPTIRLYEKGGSVALITGSCILSVMTLLILIQSICTAIFLPKEAHSDSDSTNVHPSRQDRIDLFSKHCGFTPREQEVFEKLITTEDGVQEIADSLFVSRRVLQRYISSIYEKTGTKSRIGLFQRFSDYTD